MESWIARLAPVALSVLFAGAATSCLDSPLEQATGEQAVEVAGGRPAAAGLEPARRPGDTGLAFETWLSLPAESPLGGDAGDFDGDEIADLVVANRDAGTVSVFPGGPAGALGAARIFDVGDGPSAVAAADLDEDGDLDVAVANTASADLSLLRGRGDGAFEREVRIDAGGAPVAVAVADFDRDGHLDLAVAGGVTNLLLGRGDGSFAPRRPVGPFGSLIMAPDLNGDGNPDLAVLDRLTDAGLRVLIGGGDGSFVASAALGEGFRMRGAGSGDFDRDGRVDVVLAGGPDDGLFLYLGRGDGTFGDALFLDFEGEVGPGPLLARDLDGDGLLDVVASIRRAGDVSVWFGVGDGTFRAGPRFAAGDRLETLVAADFDGDGEVDLAGPTDEIDAVRVLLGTGGGFFRAPRHLLAGGEPLGVGIADLDADGSPDLVVTNEAAQDDLLLFGRGDGTFDPVRSTFLGGLGTVWFSAGDFDGDRILDLAFDTGAGALVCLGNGDRTFRDPIVSPLDTRTTGLAAADVDRDGALDLVLADADSPAVLSLLGRGDGSFDQPRRSATEDAAVAVALGDVDGDGVVDAAAVHRSTGRASVLLGRGDGAFGAARAFDLRGVGPVAVLLADLDGDGMLDLATANAGSGDVSVLFGAGGGRFRAPRVFGVGGSPTFLAAADFDRDGRQDLAAQTGVGVAVLAGKGHRRFRPAEIIDPPSRGLAAGDVNRDGRPDIASNHPSTFVNLVLGSSPAR
jgi:hypothetical protein